MKKMTTLMIAFGAVILFPSCLQKGIVKFQSKPDEIVATPQIKAFMQQNPNPSIVLRVPTPVSQSTQADPNNYIYNAIEKELVIAGFNVKDRGLFREIITKSSSIDYEQVSYDHVSKITGVDLILEIVRADNDFKFGTNRVYRKGNEVVLKNYTVEKYGAVVEFKLVIIKNNEYGGSYSFFDTPCSGLYEDCNCMIGYKNGGSKVYPHISFCNDKRSIAFEGNEQNRLENLVRQGVQKLISEIRK